MQDFRKLRVWQESHALSVEVYRRTRRFPQQEMYGLTSQMRRAAMSVPTNIAEGCGRRGSRELARFLSIALGSSNELHFQLLLARDLELLAPAECQDLEARVEAIGRMLSTLLRKVVAATR